MADECLNLDGRNVFMHKGVQQADFRSESILSHDPWLYTELWFKRKKSWDALSFWSQARRFSECSLNAPVEASPLLIYYAFLNAAKALLVYKNVAASNSHGVHGDRPDDAKAVLANETVRFNSGGVLPALCTYFNESSTGATYNLKNILYNVPFVHRAFRLTFTTSRDLFLPISNPRYVRKVGSSEAWFKGEIAPRYSDHRKLVSIPNSFEAHDEEGVYTVRRKKRFRWYSGRSSKAKLTKGHENLQAYHAQTRRLVVNISGPRDAWYLKKSYEDNPAGSRHTLILLFAGMHRLSELARYDPNGLDRHLSGQANWLLTEFIRGSLNQFIDQVATEVTGCQFWAPNYTVN